MQNIYDANYADALPPPLKGNPELYALGKAVAEQMRATAQAIKHNRIYTRIGELDERTLDILAYDLRVDWYDLAYPLETKRAIIKDCVKVHQKIGTKAAVEMALSAVYPDAKVAEWFEYGGKPFTFKVVLSAGDNDAAKREKVFSLIQYYKNLRSHLDAIVYHPNITGTAKIYAGAKARSMYQIIKRKVDMYGVG